MSSGIISGLFATTVGGVPKPQVPSIEVEFQGIKDEIIRDKKHHGGPQRAVCIVAEEIIHELQDLGHPIAGGTTGENILLNIAYESLEPGVQLDFDEVKLEITKAAVPCKTISGSFLNGEFMLLSNKKRPGKTRWYARVLQEGTIHDSEKVTISTNV